MFRTPRLHSLQRRSASATPATGPRVCRAGGHCVRRRETARELGRSVSASNRHIRRPANDAMAAMAPQNARGPVGRGTARAGGRRIGRRTARLPETAVGQPCHVAGPVKLDDPPLRGVVVVVIAESGQGLAALPTPPLSVAPASEVIVVLVRSVEEHPAHAAMYVLVELHGACLACLPGPPPVEKGGARWLSYAPAP